MIRQSALVIAMTAAVWSWPPVAGASMTAQPAATPGPASAGAARPAAAARWGAALEVPGIARLNAGGEAFVLSLGCASAGNCAAGGMYRDRLGRAQAFLVNQSRGRWGRAEEVPGTAPLNAGGDGGIVAVSCPLAGHCTAVGLYLDRRGHYHSFAAAQRNGRWGRAAQIPGPAKLSAGGNVEVGALSCAAAGDCTAVGYYTERGGREQAFADSAVNGRWGRAAAMPGLAALNTGGFVEIGTVSCARPGYCSTGGAYKTGSASIQAFVDNQRQGRWGTAQEVPGTAALNAGGNADITTVSCTAAGTCSAGGVYVDASGSTQALVVAETNGTWRTAKEAPGTAALNAGGFAGIDSMSCAKPGNCSAGGSFTSRLGDTEAFVITEKHGRWGQAEEAPGTAALNTGGFASVDSVSCWSAGQCSAGGSYLTRAGTQAFVIDQNNGIWGKAQRIPDSTALNKAGFSRIISVSCRPTGRCSAGGVYWDRPHHAQAFVLSRA